MRHAAKLLLICLLSPLAIVAQNIGGGINNPGSSGGGTTTGPSGTPTNNDILTSNGTANQVQDPSGCTLTASALTCPSSVSIVSQGQFQASAAGTVSSPSILWTPSGGLGFYKVSGSSEIRFETASTDRIGFTGSAIKMFSGVYGFGSPLVAGISSPSSDVINCGNGAANDSSCTFNVATLNPSTGIVGVSTNSSAPAGDVGELISSQVVKGSAVSLTSGTAANVTSVSLTAGDWDCSGAVDFTFGATTSVSNMAGSISQTSATMGGQDSGFDSAVAAMVPTAANDATFPLPVVQNLLSGTTTVFLVAKATFTVSTTSSYGTIRCRRVR